MKKVVLSLIMTFALALGIAMPAPAANNLPVFVEGQKVAEPALVQNGVSYLPMRAIYEAIYASVSWNGKTQTVTAERFGSAGTYAKATLPLNAKSANLAVAGGAELTVDYTGRKPFAQNDCVYIPVRLASELMGYDVTWANGRVDIEKRYLVNGTAETGMCRLDLQTGEVSQLAAGGGRHILGRLALPSLDEMSNYYDPSSFQISQTPNGHYLALCDGMGSGALTFLYQVTGWIDTASSTVKTCVCGENYQPVWTGSKLWVYDFDDGAAYIDDAADTVSGMVTPVAEFGCPIWSDGRFVLAGCTVYDTANAKLTDFSAELITDEARAKIDAWIEQDYFADYDYVWKNINNDMSLDAHVFLRFDKETTDQKQDGKLYYLFGIEGQVIDPPAVQTLTYALPK